MATYFDGNAEMQANGDGLQTLLLMNQQQQQQPSNVVFLNASSAVNHSNPPPSQTHHLTGIPQYQDVSAREEVKQGLSLSLSPQQAVEEVNVHVVLSCKYLKVAQELLDEVVCLRKNGRQSATTADQLSAGDGRDKLSTAEKQEIQMKKAKLVNMLHQVEQRYKQYQHEMQMVISWFEQAAGEASAITYTALALQTISKQFRSLKDAVLVQIRVLGQQHTLRGLMEGSSRLKYIDTQIRPQRGLPERSVSVLRAWLLDHFLHPYPKDTDKIMLAKQTGLTRTQVSNWFINARVRLWKPMVTEMYSEEVKGHQHHNIAGKTKHLKLPKPKEAAETEINNNTSSTAADVENQHIAMNFFASYPMEHFRPPYSGSGVSLTLGLQHCENLPNQDFMSNQTMNLEPAGRNHFAPPTPAHAHDSIPVYDSIDVQTSNKRFAGAAQLLPDFVT